MLAACAAGLALAYLARLLLIKVVGTGGRDLCLVMLTAYLVLFSISLAQNTQTEKHGRVTDELRPEVLIRQRCDELSGFTAFRRARRRCSTTWGAATTTAT